MGILKIPEDLWELNFLALAQMTSLSWMPWRRQGKGKREELSSEKLKEKGRREQRTRERKMCCSSRSESVCSIKQRRISGKKLIHLMHLGEARLPLLCLRLKPVWICKSGSSIWTAHCAFLFSCELKHWVCSFILCIFVFFCFIHLNLKKTCHIKWKYSNTMCLLKSLNVFQFSYFSIRSEDVTG